MLINEINLRDESGRMRAEALVTWEEANRPPLKFFVETDAGFRSGFWCDPNGFLVAAILPAWHAGERRVKVDGSICPILNSKIKAALATLQSWYPDMGSLPTIESARGFHVHRPFKTQAASFLSCGIDSLATLRSNKLRLPTDHPLAISAAIAIDYLNAPGISLQEAANRSRKRLAAASRVSENAGIYLIPLQTNILALDQDGYFFADKWNGAVLAAIAYFFSREFAHVYIASGENPKYLAPWGSHPLIDPYYSSSYLQIEHHGLEMSRLDKIALVADWQIGLNNILVCEGKDSGVSNCGTCAKCIQTMTALLALGKLKDCQSFPADDVSADLLITVGEYDMLYSDYHASIYRDLILPLTKIGRPDLVAEIDNFLLAYAKKKRQA
jgi:hypothetical protein